MKPVRALVVTGLVAASAACGAGGGAATTITEPGGPVGTTAVAPTTTLVTLSDLSGTWGNDAVVLEVNDGGEYILREAGGAAGPAMGGFVARDGDLFSFVTSTTGECPGQTGTYHASVEGGTLTLTLVDDPCQLRVSGFSTPLGPSG